MMCEACKRDDHANCGLQTWCECECDGTADFDLPLDEAGYPAKPAKALLSIGLEPGAGITAAEFADALEEVPRDDGAAEADIPWLPDYLERVYGWSRKGPRP